MVIGIPGALSPITVLGPLEQLASPETTVAFYRLPGFDGRPAAEFVNLDYAAHRITRAVTQAGVTRVALVGHSTGSAIALEAAKQLRRTAPGVSVQVIGISTALPVPQPQLAGIRGAAGTVRAAIRARSLNPRVVWLEYYRVLGYGRQADTDPQIAQAADGLVRANSDRISLPAKGLGRRHTRALRQWRNRDPDALRGAEVVFYHGAVDPVFPIRVVADFAQTLPQAELKLMTGHGHLLLLTFPQLWDQIATDIGR